MSTELEAVLDAYIDAWNEPEPTARARLLAAALDEEAAFSGPTGDFRGREAIAALIEAIRSRMPGAAVVRTGPASTTGGDIRFAWQIRTGGGGVLMEGVDEIERGRDGRLTLVRMVTGDAS